MNTVQHLLELLNSKRTLRAYVVINSGAGVYVKQNKSAWIETLEQMNSTDSIDYVFTPFEIIIH